MPKKIIEEKAEVKKENKISRNEKVSSKPKAQRAQYYMAVGRRKTAQASVKLKVGGTGQFIVNKIPIEKYFYGEAAKSLYLEPLKLTNSLDRFDIIIKVEGSGKSSQLGAVIHGLARALQTVDREAYRSLLKKRGFLTRDARARERRKPGQAGRARAKKQSPKR